MLFRSSGDALARLLLESVVFREVTAGEICFFGLRRGRRDCFVALFVLYFFKPDLFASCGFLVHLVPGRYQRLLRALVLFALELLCWLLFEVLVLRGLHAGLGRFLRQFLLFLILLLLIY